MGNRRETQQGLIRHNETRGNKTRYTAHRTIKIKQETRDNHKDGDLTQRQREHGDKLRNVKGKGTGT